MSSNNIVGKTVVCSNCQGTITYGDKQCAYCGAALSWPEDQHGRGVVAQPIVINVVQQPVQPSQPVAPQPMHPAPQPVVAATRKSGGGALLTCLIVTVILVVLSGAAFFAVFLLWPVSVPPSTPPISNQPSAYIPPEAPDESPTSARVTASEYCSQADSALRAGDPNGAETAARNAIAAGGDNRTMASAHYLLGFAFERQGRTAEAISEYQISLNLRSDGRHADRVRRRLTGLRGH